MNENVTKVDYCRCCRNTELITIMDLGLHPLSSRFPSSDEADPFSAPLVLMKCDDRNGDYCGLLQLGHNVSENELYLNHYGYRSGLNNTMISHLGDLVKEIESKIQLNNDIVLDIGSNDSTLLRAYNNNNLIRVGIDPTGEQFRQYYPANVTLLPTFFNKSVYEKQFVQKAKVVTTVSMFYDLPDPVAFAKDVKAILADDGIWVSEQSYCVTMLENNSFDTICSEHLEYYTLKQFQYIGDKVGLEIIDVSLNLCNGGSFRVTLAHPGIHSVKPIVQTLLNQESKLNLSHLLPLNQFIERCETMKNTLVSFLKHEILQNKTCILLGASTKGNTLLQYYGLNNTLIKAASERNPEKYGRRTPGSNIPIVSEQEARDMNPDYLLVLPWHFKKELLSREQEYMEKGVIIFPMPQLEFYNKHGLIKN